MRGILAITCGAVYLAFGMLAGAAHLHESADHHAESRGLHLDHAHVGDAAAHGQKDHLEHHSHDGDAPLAQRHFAHHEGDILYLSATTMRSSGSHHRLLPAIVSFGAADEPPEAMSIRDVVIPGPPRDPPRTNRIRPRAPPA